MNGRDGVEQGVGIGTTRATFFCFWFFFAALVSTSTAAEGLLFPSLTLLPALSQPNLSLSRARPLKHTGEKKKTGLEDLPGPQQGHGHPRSRPRHLQVGGGPRLLGGDGREDGRVRLEGADPDVVEGVAAGGLGEGAREPGCVVDGGAERGRKGRGDREREEVLAAPFSLARPLPRCADTGKSENRKMTRKIISSHSSLKLKALSLYWRGPLFSNRLSDSRLRAPCLFDFLFLELFLSDDDEEKKQKTKNSNQTFPLPFQVSPAPSPEPAAARVRRSSWPR